MTNSQDRLYDFSVLNKKHTTSTDILDSNIITTKYLWNQSKPFQLLSISLQKNYF